MEKSNWFSLDEKAKRFGLMNAPNSIISGYPEQDISAYQRGSNPPVNIEALETRAQGYLNFFEDIFSKVLLNKI